MKKLFLLPILAIALLVPSIASAGGSLFGEGVLRHEPCQSDNLLVHDGTYDENWEHRVTKPEYCIHIYMDDDAYVGSMYYTLPYESRVKTGYYDDANYLGDIDDIENGTRVEVHFSVTGGTTDNLLITDVIGEEIYITPIGEQGAEITGAPPAGYEDEVITTFDLYENPFPDTDSSSLEGIAASELYRRAVIGGYKDGEFKGTRYVNRAEGAKFLLLARYNQLSDLNNNGKFPDVLDGEWYTSYVIHAANLGIINGYIDGLFRPAYAINTAEFLKMLTKTFDLEEGLPNSYMDVDEDDWFYKYAGTAQEYNLFPYRTSELIPGDLLSRNEVAVAIYQYLSNR